MILLVSGTTKSVGKLAKRYPDMLGHLITPTNRNGVESLLSTGLSWAADNGAYSGFDEDRFRRLLRRVQGRPRLLWIACPDVVGDSAGTASRFDEWQEEVAQAGPVAFVGQDGCEETEIPWDRFACLFIGGSTEWKLSGAAVDLATEARQRGKWVHLGRVNSRKRISFAWAMRADSIDGSSASMFGDKYIHKYLRWMNEMLAWPSGA